MSEAVTLAEEKAPVDSENTEKTTTEPTAGEKPAAEEEAGYKVFVGNLAFQTTEVELTDFFANVGKVIKANIITRGTRSLGYGFVALETEEDAQKVVNELNKSELGGRQINVEVAKPKSENAGNLDSQGASARRGRGGRFGFRGRNSRGRGRGRLRGRGRGGWSRRRFSSRPAEESGEANAENNQSTAVTSGSTTANGTNEDPPNGKSRGFGRRRGTRGRLRGRSRMISRRRSTNSNQAAGAAKTGDPSKTIVFVANLPFSVDDEGLKDIFKDYKVTSAHVVRRRGGRSKGFGFVELADEEEQQKALEGLKGVKSQERELVIKVALSDQHVPAGDEEKATGTIDSAVESEGIKESVQPA